MRKINPQKTTRAYAFEMWMQAPMPMVTFFKTLDVLRLVRISRKRGAFKTTLSVSFQFHHTQMDGAHAAKFLDILQREIDELTV